MALSQRTSPSVVGKNRGTSRLPKLSTRSIKASLARRARFSSISASAAQRAWASTMSSAPSPASAWANASTSARAESRVANREQAVADRVLSGALFAGGRARAGTFGSVAAVGRDLAFACHPQAAFCSAPLPGCARWRFVQDLVGLLAKPLRQSRCRGSSITMRSALSSRRLAAEIASSKYRS